MKTLTPVSSFDDVDVPEGLVDLRTAASVEVGFQAVTNRTEHLKDNKITGPASATSNALVRFDGTTGKLAKNSGVRVTDGGEIEYVTSIPRTKSLGSYRIFRPRSEGSSWVSQSNGYWQIGTNQTDVEGLFADITQFLCAGQIITGISVRMQPGAARAPGQRCGIQLFFRNTLSLSSSYSSLGSDADDGTTNAQLLTIAPGAGTHTVDGACEYILVAFKGANTAGGNDLFHGVSISFNDPGPRNA